MRKDDPRGPGDPWYIKVSGVLFLIVLPFVLVGDVLPKMIGRPVPVWLIVSVAACFVTSVYLAAYGFLVLVLREWRKRRATRQRQQPPL